MAYVDEHSATVDVPPARAWALVSRLGGDERLYAPRLVWRVRGLADRLLGGPGHRIQGTGRPLRVGDPMDFWEVVGVEPPTRLRLRALTRLPGTAYLDIVVGGPGTGTGTGTGTRTRTKLTMRTTFDPAGVAGHVYWWSNLAAHQATFALMTRRLAAMVSQVSGIDEPGGAGGTAPVTGG
jgi:hypothetical protein